MPCPRRAARHKPLNALERRTFEPQVLDRGVGGRSAWRAVRNRSASLASDLIAFRQHNCSSIFGSTPPPRQSRTFPDHGRGRCLSTVGRERTQQFARHYKDAARRWRCHFADSNACRAWSCTIIRQAAGVLDKFIQQRKRRACVRCRSHTCPPFLIRME